MARIVILALIAVLLVAAATHKEDTRRLPDGRSQTLAIVKASHKRALKNIAEIRTLAGELTEEMERDTEHGVSLDAIKKLDRIEELARNVKDRMRRSQ